MGDLTPYLVLGLAVGGVYAVCGVGLTVLYRTTGVVNMAYGATGAIGAMVAWQLITVDNVNRWLAYLACIGVTTVVSTAYGVGIAPLLARRDPLVKAASTLAVMLLLLGIMSWVWGQEATSLTLPTTNVTFNLGSVSANATQAIGLGLGVLVTVGITIYLRVNRVGTVMRAMANDREATALLGVPVRRIEALAWAGSGVLCGITALLLANLYGLNYAGMSLLVITFLAASLVGRLASLWVAMIAALAIGVFQSFMISSQTFSPYQSAVPFVLAILALLWYGRHRTVFAAGLAKPATVAAAAKVLRPPSLRRPTPNVVAATAGALLVFFLVPNLFNNYWLQISTGAVIYCIVGLGVSLLAGRVGMVSLAQVALLALGAWVALRLHFATDMPFPLLLLVTGLITMVIGVIIGLPALRLSGLELALVTLMAAGAVATVLSLENFPNSNHGFFGYDISGPTTGSIPAPQYAGTTASFFRYCLVVAAILFVLVVIHVSMRPGRTWAAIRQSQASALAVGVNVTRYKLWAFALAAFVTGVGGALLAASPGGVTPGQFPAQDSITLLAVVLMAGAYNFWGAVLAGVLFQLLPALLTYWGVSSDLSLILFGVGALQVFTTAPGGLVGQTQAQARWLITKIRPAASARHAARLEPSADQARGGEDRDTGGQRSVAVPVPGARS